MRSFDDLCMNFIVRPATADDVSVVARHRAEMFTDMGKLPRALYDVLVAESMRYLEGAIPIGEYLGWLAAPRDRPQEIIAGAGVQQRHVLPHPLERPSGTMLAFGRQAIVLNVFTERAWRRHGLARHLMDHVLAWARVAGVDTLVLHASDEGRTLYEELGFVATNEMRYAGDLC